MLDEDPAGVRRVGRLPKLCLLWQLQLRLAILVRVVRHEQHRHVDFRRHALLPRDASDETAAGAPSLSLSLSLSLSQSQKMNYILRVFHHIRCLKV